MTKTLKQISEPRRRTSNPPPQYRARSPAKSPSYSTVGVCFGHKWDGGPLPMPSFNTTLPNVGELVAELLPHERASAPIPEPVVAT